MGIEFWIKCVLFPALSRPFFSTAWLWYLGERDGVVSFCLGFALLKLTKLGRIAKVGLKLFLLIYKKIVVIP